MRPAEVLIKHSDIKEMQKAVMEEAEEGRETGVHLLGTILQNRIYVVTRYVPAGPNAVKDSVTFTTDEKVIAVALGREMEKDKNVKYLSDFHSHTFRGKPSPSFIDMNQLKLAKNERSWFVIGVFSPDGQLRIFDIDENDNPVEIPFRIIPDDFDGQGLLSRISEITDNEVLKKTRIALIGGGSLGSGAISGLAVTGILDYMVCDMDKLSLVNVIRHLGNVLDIGNEKTKIVKDYIHSKQPFARVQTVSDDLVKNRELLRAVIESSDIVVASSGNPELNYSINSICIELRKPVVFAGIYDRAESAYVFYYSGKEDACCFDCIFKLTSAAVDQNTINRRYGLTDGELKGAQGHWCDIAIPGLMMAKVALNILLGNEMAYNLIRYHSDNRVNKFNVTRRKLCATCDYENWLKNEEEKLKEKNLVGKLAGFLKIVFSKIVGRIKLVF